MNICKPTQNSLRQGLGFGLTSGVITTLGLIVGLSFGTDSKLVVIGGVLTVALADAFSDALGIHISVESEKNVKEEDVWGATIAAFTAKTIFALIFLVPLIFLSLKIATISCVILGLIILGIYSFFLAKNEKISPSKAIIEHVSVAVVVIALTAAIGHLVRSKFN